MTEETKTAKIPEGVTVETPKPTELKKLPIPDFFIFDEFKITYDYNIYHTY